MALKIGQENMTYTLNDIKNRVAPIASAYRLPAVYLFGSYARDQADERSDIDLAISVTGTKLSGLDLFDLEDQLQAQFRCPLDFLVVEDIELARNPIQETLKQNFRAERILIYKRDNNL